MNRSRIIFFGSRDSKFSDGLFFALADTYCDIKAVVHSPEGGLKSTSGKKTGTGYAEAACERGIPGFMPENPNSPDFIEKLCEYPCDAFILGGYTMLVKDELLKLPAKGIAINFHASLLPNYKGKHPVFWAIRNGELKSGITAHHLSRGIDEGDIAFQEEVRIEQNDSVAEVYEKVIEKSRAVMSELIDAINQGETPAIPQKAEGTYFSSISEEDYIIDFSLGANRNKLAVQATPGKCYIQTQKGKLFAFEAKTVTGIKEKGDGVIIAMDDESVIVSSGEEAICFSRLSAGGETVCAGKLMRDMGFKVSDKI